MKLNENTLRRLLLCGALVCALSLNAGIARSQQANAGAVDNKITAIDILLEPEHRGVRLQKYVDGRNFVISSSIPLLSFRNSCV